MVSTTPTAHSMESHRLTSLPPSGFYIHNFITEQEEEYLLRKIEESPQPRWRRVGTGRRLQYLGGTLTKNNALIQETLPPWVTSFPNLIERIADITNAIQAVASKDHENGSTTAGEGLISNQLLVNEYQAGQGIFPHEDGPAYHPVVATISLGSPQTLEIFQYLSHTDPSPPLTASPSTSTSPTTPNPTEDESGSAKPIAAVPMSRVYLEPRSLFVMTSSLYRTHLHGIAAVEKDVISAPKSEVTVSEPAVKIMDGDGEGEGMALEETEKAGATEIANMHLLGDEKLRDELLEGKVVERDRTTRVSLTFRKVEKVVKSTLLGRGGSGLFGKK